VSFGSDCVGQFGLGGCDFRMLLLVQRFCVRLAELRATGNDISYASPCTKVLFHELVKIASSIYFADREDAIVWKMHFYGVYSVQSLCAAINFRAVWQVYSGDNVAKRQAISHQTCFFVMSLRLWSCCDGPENQHVAGSLAQR
jgi:hypothetical protein